MKWKNTLVNIKLVLRLSRFVGVSFSRIGRNVLNGSLKTSCRILTLSLLKSVVRKLRLRIRLVVVPLIVSRLITHCLLRVVVKWSFLLVLTGWGR